MENKELIKKILKKVLEEAEILGMNAAYGGSMNDGGESRLVDAVRYYQLGQQNIIPGEWLKYLQQVEKESDPEYSEFLRLQNKFDNDGK